VHTTLDPWISEWGNPALVMQSHPSIDGGKPGEVKHLSTRRTRKRSDFPSSGERTGRSLNLDACDSLQALCIRGSGTVLSVFADAE
jgi:hypothetical protein